MSTAIVLINLHTSDQPLQLARACIFFLFHHAEHIIAKLSTFSVAIATVNTAYSHTTSLPGSEGPQEADVDGAAGGTLCMSHGQAEAVPHDQLCIAPSSPACMWQQHVGNVHMDRRN